MIAKLFKSRCLGDMLASEASRSLALRAASRRRQPPSLSDWLGPAAVPAAPSDYQSRLEAFLSAEELEQRRQRGRGNDRKINAALASLGLATAGLWLWPLKLLCFPLIVYVTGHWYVKAYRLLRQRKVGVPTLFVFTVTGVILNGFVWIGSLASLVAQLSIKLTHTVTADSRNRLIDVFRQTPKSAWMAVDGAEIEIPLEQVHIGQTVIVNAGETIPVDGTIVSGAALVDEHLLTGEGRPVEKTVEDPIFAGALLLSGRIEARVDKAGNDTAIARIGQILNDTIEYKSEAQLRAETLADRTVAPTLCLGALALPILGPMGALAVVDAHFRQRLSILSPLALMNYLNLASRSGILVKDGRSLDLLHQVDTLVFDKTGTLTQEQPTVLAVHAWLGLEADAVLRLAAAAERKQSHPIAKAILAEAQARGLSLPALEALEYQVGFGLCAQIEGEEIRVGSRRFMAASAIAAPAELAALESQAHAQGHSLVLIACAGRLAGAVELAPTLRPQAKAMIQALKRRHHIKETYLISGDQAAPTAQLAAELDIDHCFAEVLPQQKAELIERLIAEGRFVCYVGDGVNDAIALKKAHVSISLGGASSVAVDVAQIILMEGDLAHLIKLFDYAHEFRRNTDISFAIVTSASLIGVCGAFFLHFGLLQTTMLAVASLIGGVGNAMRPLLLRREAPAQPALAQGQE
jgi:Cu2+-exporting ATPase